MGTRLQTTEGRTVWDPDNAWHSVLMAFWGPRQRKREFIGGETHKPGYLVPITIPKKILAVRSTMLTTVRAKNEDGVSR